ncbi:hypothetical protein BGX26_007868 [Mortierella sp. AD094]|nr:hypothetical protein BGX26_007868 [Mortierella sp. AD094]
MGSSLKFGSQSALNNLPSVNEEVDESEGSDEEVDDSLIPSDGEDEVAEDSQERSSLQSSSTLRTKSTTDIPAGLNTIITGLSDAIKTINSPAWMDTGQDNSTIAVLKDTISKLEEKIITLEKENKQLVHDAFELRLQNELLKRGVA